MIFPKDVASAVNWMEARWGSAGSAWESWQEFAVDFEPYDLKEFWRVLEEFVQPGNDNVMSARFSSVLMAFGEVCADAVVESGLGWAVTEGSRR